MDQTFIGQHQQQFHKRRLLIGLFAGLALIGTIAAVYSASPSKSLTLAYDNSFELFVEQFEKKYSNDLEYQLRRGIYYENLNKIAEFNQQNKNIRLGPNHLTDLTQEEFAQYYHGTLPKKTNRNTVYLSNDNPPESVNWVDQGAVTPVKNQGMCGSCWAFSAIGSIEGAWFLANNTLTSFSEQQLVDCSSSYGNHGCLGGEMDDAFKYEIKEGAMTESDYPYKGLWSFECHYNSTEVVGHISSFVDVEQGSEDQLQLAVAKQPVSVAVDAGGLAWQFYQGGIMDGNCGTSLDHGVLAVGYGNENGKDYWLVKNSWGASWGEKGYIRLARGKNECGIADDASYPVV